MTITREHCEASDARDELAPLRQEFELPDGVIYLDGNSLGARPRRALAHAQDVVQREWGVDLIHSWNKADWWNLPLRLGNQMAPLVGAGADEIVVTDSTSINLYKVLANALRMQQQRQPHRKVIVAERDAFPTDLYMVQGLIASLGQGHTLQLLDDPQDLPGAVTEQTAIVLLSHVNYRTGYLYDMAACTALAHERGALAVWDLCHSIGAVPVDLNAANADFAIGCTYKYLNGGPGAPAMLWAHPRHRRDFWQPLSGWWGHARPFDMAVDYVPEHGIRSFLCGTQPIVSLGLVACGVEIFLKTDMQRVRAKSLALTDLFIDLVEQECTGMDLTLVTPREHAHRGSHVSLRHPEGYALVQALIARGVVGDYREPEVARFGVTPLYLRYVDIWDAVQHLKAVLQGREWAQARFHRRGDVT
ncbi:MAG: kynureninase [Comamonadaceae bacterium]|nr:kynureninase [Burkholderiales bacterium]MEB2349585.1 kynureninase [Comamonadaceae bacterium]